MYWDKLLDTLHVKWDL